MTASVERRSARRVPRLLPLAFAAALLAEILFLTFTLDTQNLVRLPSVWAVLVGWSPQCLRLITTTVLVGGLLGGRAVWQQWERERQSVPFSWRRVAFMVVHLAALGLFARISALFFDGGAAVAAAPAMWAFAWTLAGGLTAAAWAAALLPLGAWWRVARAHAALIACSLVVGVAVWALGFVSESFWQPMARQTYACVAWVLAGFYPVVISHPEILQLGTPTFVVEIAPQCSGYEGVGLIVAFLTTYLFVFRRELRFPGALLLLPIGAAVIWALNIGRIAALIAIGSAGWEGVALGGFHSQAGWLTFNAVALGFVVVARSARVFAQDATRPLARRPADDATSPYLVPLLSLLAIAMVSGAVSSGFDWLYPVRLLVLIPVLWSFRQTYRQLNWSVSWVGPLCGAAAFAVWMLLLPDGLAGKDDWPATLRTAGSTIAHGWLACRALGYVLAVPFAEELAFRGFLTRRFWMSDTDPSGLGRFGWAAFLLSSVIFGVLHGRLWVAGTIAGMLFALALYHRRSLGDALLAHAVTNGLIAAYVFTTGRWSVWS
jgi:exosortase E/protease (VPEID-CTERM system)